MKGEDEVKGKRRKNNERKKLMGTRRAAGKES